MICRITENYMENQAKNYKITSIYIRERLIKDTFKKIIKKLQFGFCNTRVANDIDKIKNLKKETRGER